MLININNARLVIFLASKEGFVAMFCKSMNPDEEVLKMTALLPRAGFLGVMSVSCTAGGPPKHPLSNEG